MNFEEPIGILKKQFNDYMNELITKESEMDRIVSEIEDLKMRMNELQEAIKKLAGS